MKVEIIDKVENPMLKRAELKFRADHAGAPTPKRLEVRAQLAALLGVAEELIVIDKLASAHGHHVASGIARAYSSREQLESTEPKYLLERGLPKEAKAEKPKKEKPKPEKFEKPAKEGKPEEKPKEAKPEKAGAPKEAEAKEKAAKAEVKEKPKGEGEGGKGS